MKRIFACAWLGFIFSLPTLYAAEQVVLTREAYSPVVSSRGPHHREWSREVVETRPGPGGSTRSVTNRSSYVELASGMHKWNAQAGTWEDASEAITVEGNTAVARGGQNQLAFAGNANTAGAIDLTMPTGARLKSHVLGLAFFDTRTGQSQMFAELTNSAGELHPPNVVLYTNALVGDGFRADLRYTSRLGSFEQDVVVRTPLPELPQDWDEASVMVEVWTEFLDPPAPAITTRSRSGQMSDTIDFGPMQTGLGRAFALGEEEARGPEIPVATRWLTVEGRTFLVESVRYSSVKPHLENLPRQASLTPPANQGRAALPRNRALSPQNAAKAPPTLSLRPFPAAPPVREARLDEKNARFRTAAVVPTSHPSDGGEPLNTIATNASIRPSPITPRTSTERGFVIDYLLQQTLSNFTFKADTSYVASNTVTLSGTTTWEGNCVIKFARTNTAKLVVTGSTDWRTGPYHPAIFTAADDNTVGETIAGSTGTPTGYYGGVMLSVDAEPVNPFQHLRLSYATVGIKSTDRPFTVRHAQFVHCGTALDYPRTSGAVTNENVLFYDLNTVINGGAYFVGRNITVHHCGQFGSGTAGLGQLLNSVIIDYADWGSTTLSETSTYSLDSDDPAIFQTVGAAAHYLAPNSPYRNVGSALSGQLASDLAQFTTYPPVVFSNTTLTADTTLYPQARRDTDTPDLGYHYPPLDFVAGQVNLTNATLTLAPGTALGLFSPDGQRALQLLGGQLICHGTATALNQLARYNCVQEQANANWTGSGTAIVTPSFGTSGPAAARFRFTELSGPAGHSLFQDNLLQDAALALVDCSVRGGSFANVRASLSFTNCLLDRVTLAINDLDAEHDFHARHCLFREAKFPELLHYGATTWTFSDNLFDNTAISQDGDVTPAYNAYTTNTTRLTPTNVTGNVFLATSNLNYQTWGANTFYLSATSLATNLFDKGSTWATNVGLYHYTTTTNQTKEASSKVDIGFHYVALASGVPIDTDSDGLADYLEDRNGNGGKESSESNWAGGFTDTDGDGVSDYLEVLLGRNPLIAGTTNDVGGTLNLRVYTPLK